MRTIPIFVCLIAAFSIAVAAAAPGTETALAFQRYVRLTEQRIDSEVAGSDRFLWLDTLPPNRRGEFQKGLQQGGVVIERLQTRDGSKEIEAPNGLIHHWVGVVFVPRVTVKEAVALMQDYDRHSKFFAPAIARLKDARRTMATSSGSHSVFTSRRSLR